MYFLILFPTVWSLYSFNKINMLITFILSEILILSQIFEILIFRDNIFSWLFSKNHIHKRGKISLLLSHYASTLHICCAKPVLRRIPLGGYFQAEKDNILSGPCPAHDLFNMNVFLFTPVFSSTGRLFSRLHGMSLRGTMMDKTKRLVSYIFSGTSQRLQVFGCTDTVSPPNSKEVFDITSCHGCRATLDQE